MAAERSAEYQANDIFTQIFRLHLCLRQNGTADHSMEKIDDWERIQYVINNYDTIEAGGRSSAYTTIKNNGNAALAKTVVYKKAVNGTYYVVEAVPDSNARSIYVKSAYISKKDSDNSTVEMLSMPAEADPQLTPKALNRANTITPVNNSVSQQLKNVKSLDEDLKAKEASAVQAAYEAGLEEVPSDQISLESDEQIDAYFRGRREAIMTQSTKSYGYGESGTKVFDELVEAEQDERQELKPRFQMAYEAGLMGIEDAEFTDNVQQKAYEAGKADSAESLRKAIERSKKTPSYLKNGGLIKTVASKKVDRNELKLMDALGKTLGVKIQYANQVLDGDANGVYQDGKITLALDAEKKLVIVAKHEITHHMQTVSPKEYFTYRNYAVQYAAQERGISAITLVESYQKRAVNNGMSLSVEGAMDDIAADFTERILTNEEELSAFIDSMSTTKQNRNVLNRFFEAIRNFIDKIKAVFNGNKEMMDSAAFSEFGATIDSLERAEQLWKDMAIATAEKVKTAKTLKTEKNTAEKDGAKMSMKNDIEVSDTKYSYDALVNKPDMLIAEITHPLPIKDDGKINKKEVATLGTANVREKNHPKNTENRAFVRVEDAKSDVLVSITSIRHSLTRNAEAQAMVSMNIGDVLENSIVINEVNPRDNTNYSYVLLGIAKDKNNNYYPVRALVVNGVALEFEVLDVLYSISAKKKDQSAIAAGLAVDSATLKGLSTISIAKLLDLVKYDFSDVFSKDVLEKLEAKRNKSALSNSVKYSLKDSFEHTDKQSNLSEQKAVDYFGKTYSWAETGYITPNGTKLDFSGKKDGAPGGYRAMDHREIIDIMDNFDSGTDAMVDFMKQGNIRISSESNGINLSVEPTKSQYNSLGEFINRSKGEVIVDIDDINGYTVSSVEYPKGMRSTKIIADIKQYFSEGKIPEVSEVQRFRYSLKSQSDLLAEKQKCFLPILPTATRRGIPMFPIRTRTVGFYIID